MSWSRRARAVLALAWSAALGGCFTPLYSESAHPGLVEAMKEIDVAPVPGRLGHYLVDDLITNMNGSGQTPTPKYKLTMIVNRGATTPTVESQIGIASSKTLTGFAQMTLTRIDNGEVIYTGQAVAAAPYDRSLDSYANLRAERDAEIRLARSLAQEIELRAAAALSGKPHPET